MARNDALIVNPATLTNWDGKSLRLTRYARELRSMGYTVSFRSLGNHTQDFEFPVMCCPEPPQIEDFYGAQKYVPVISELRNILIFTYYLALPVFFDILRKKYKVVISSCVSPQVGTLLALVICKIRGVPHIYDYDDLAPEMSRVFKSGRTGGLSYRLDLLTESLIVRNSAATIAMSNSMRAVVRGRTGVDVQVIYNAPEARDFEQIPERTTARIACGLPQGNFVMGYIGNVQLRIRGLETILEAVARIKNGIPSFRLVLIGDGPGVEPLYELARNLGVRDNLIITRKVDPSKALVYLAACDAAIVLTPTNDLGAVMAPTKLFLSMGIGHTIVASDTPELRRILGEAGVYVGDQDSVDDILYAFHEAIRRQQTQNEVSKRLVGELRAKYVWECCAAGFRSVIARLTNHD